MLGHPLAGTRRYFVKPEDGPDDGGQVCQIVDRTNLATIDHWEAIVTTKRSTRYDDHTRAIAGEPDSVPAWREEARAAPWERALVWSGALIGSAIVWYAVIVIAASVWRRVF